MNKKDSKKFLISQLCLIIFGYLISLIIFYAVTKDLRAAALYSLIPAVVTTGAYTGFIFAGMKLIEKGKLTKSVIIMSCVLFPVTFLVVSVLGIILIIPENIRAIKVLAKNEPDEEQEEEEEEEKENEKTDKDGKDSGSSK